MELTCSFVLALVLCSVLARTYATAQDNEPILQMRGDFQAQENEPMLQRREHFQEPIRQRVSLRLQEFEFRRQFQEISDEVVQRATGRLPQELLESFSTSDRIVAEQYPGVFASEVVDQDHDHDRCCPTRVLHEKPFFLQNIHGETRVLAHFPRINRFQFVRRAECVPLIGNCDGHCVIENIAAYFVVWNITSANWPFTVDRFYVPGYCSCKG